ncbi:hypothetical protein KKF34_00325 [Myxococcota bacterium]|nr:hypothetical protein [Myxococcota bacterium]MBU1380318.1 hypothetical protein [Myxococcota bacterium]MBU1495306.1 hypothetical protein [Myxococcota bacterium]
MKYSMLFTACIFFSVSIANGKNPISMGKQFNDNIKGFRPFVVNNSRFFVSRTGVWPYKPVIYDLISGQKTVMKDPVEYGTIPRRLPRYTGKDWLKARMSGKYYEWRKAELVFYDSNTTGVILIKEQHSPIQNPRCPKCGGEASIFHKTGKYYCPGCRRYLSSSALVKSSYMSYYAKINLKKNQSSLFKLYDDWVYEIANDFNNNIFYWFRDEVDKNNKKRNLRIGSFNYDQGKNLSGINIPLTYRIKNGGLRAGISKDGNYLIFLEYDEYSDSKKKIGFLENPAAQGIVVNLKTKKHKFLRIPMTPYGYDIHDKTKMVAVASNQEGLLHIYNADTGKILRKTSIPRGVFHMAISASGKYIYIFHKSSFDTFSVKTLKKLYSFPVTNLCPGIKSFLSAESMISSPDRKRVFMGIIKKNNLWGSSDYDSGFQYLDLEE